MQPTRKTMMPLAPRKQTMGHSDRSNSNNKRLIPTAHSMSSSSSSESELDQTSHRRNGTSSTRDMENSTNNSKSNNYNNKNNSGWRSYGIERRKQLLLQDEEEGGNRFVLNYKCRIQGYFALSEKVSSNFFARCERKTLPDQFPYSMSRFLIGFSDTFFLLSY